MSLDQCVFGSARPWWQCLPEWFPCPINYNTPAIVPLWLHPGSGSPLEWCEVGTKQVGSVSFTQKSCWKLFCLLLSYSPEGRTQGLPRLSDGSLYVNPVFTFCYVPQTGLELAIFLLPVKTGIARPSTRVGSQCCCCFVCLRWGLTIKPMLPSNAWSSCLIFSGSWYCRPVWSHPATILWSPF